MQFVSQKIFWNYLRECFPKPSQRHHDSIFMAGLLSNNYTITIKFHAEKEDSSLFLCDSYTKTIIF